MIADMKREFDNIEDDLLILTKHLNRFSIEYIDDFEDGLFIFDMIDDFKDLCYCDKLFIIIAFLLKDFKYSIYGENNERLYIDWSMSDIDFKYEISQNLCEIYNIIKNNHR